ncbi:non-secretory ribonuclease [Rhinolophus ferrumequinum]|uniref:non-secretory ribonuclease n=1 Tax=Rhinolophus ferrumequinum TaxID=59479 RepID=UPI00140FAF4B|nr:non-secretory ribonuclease [Rhinolophus ferrumequinum]
MIPTQRDSQLCLLLLLGLLGMAISFHGAPGNLTATQWFYTQHINMTNPQCNIAMQPINYLYFGVYGTCKRINTFLHTTYATVANICMTPNVTCPSSHYTNCHNSSTQVTVTNCNLTGRSTTYRNCRYSTSQAQKIYIVACDCRTRRDNPAYMKVPVHLDWLI